MSEFRWELADRPKSQTALFDEPIFEREPGRGEFRGMEFLHVRAQRIINDLKNAPFGFRYTINPYRGCSHACSYCLTGDTQVLMAGGNTKSLADIRPGNRIHSYARNGPALVLDHWSTTRPAFQVTLADGTSLVASGEHRFLSEAGWKHVNGEYEHPGLADGDALVRAAGPPVRVVEVVPLGTDVPMYDITTGTGDFIANGVVSHNCFARPTHEYLGLDTGDDFDSRIVVKVNAVSLLRRELDQRRWLGDLIAMGTNTDPYQRCEGKYRLTRGIIEVLAEHANPFSILTKSTLVLRDQALLAEASQRCDVRINFSIGTLDEEVWRATEPGTPHPLRRVRAVEALNKAGIACGVLIAPVLPGLSDRPEQLDAVVKACVEAGAQSISTTLLHLRPGVREVFLPRLAATHPHLVDDYRRRYRNRSYAPRAEQAALQDEVHALIARHGGNRSGPQIAPSRAHSDDQNESVEPETPASTQLSLL